MEGTALQCSSCTASDVQKLSMVYQSGKSTINATTRGTSTGIGMAGGRLGIGTSVSQNRTTGTQLTELAQRAAPPSKAHTATWVLLGLGAFVILTAMGAFGWGLTILLACGYPAYRAFRHNAEVYPGLRATWERSWLCHRCGAIFAR